MGSNWLESRNRGEVLLKESIFSFFLNKPPPILFIGNINLSGLQRGILIIPYIKSN